MEHWHHLASNDQASFTANAQKLILITSNLAYLGPVGATCYRAFFAPEQCRMTWTKATQLNLLYIFIAFFSSWSYHMCRAGVTYEDDLSQEAVFHNLPGFTCHRCPTNMMSWTKHVRLDGKTGDDMDLRMARFLDHFFAQLGIFFTIVYVMPLKSEVSTLLLIISLAWSSLFLSTDNDAMSIMPIALLGTLLVLFWYAIRNQSPRRNIYWGLSFAATFLSLLMFVGVGGPYWVSHSLWHILGAIAGTMLILGDASPVHRLQKDNRLPFEWMYDLFDIKA